MICPRLGKTLLAGLLSGIAAGVLASVVNAVLQAALGPQPILNPISITATALLTSLVGSLVYWALSRFTARAPTVYLILALVLATLNSIPWLLPDAPPPPDPSMVFNPGFGWIANPLHYIVALVAAILTPRLAR